MRYKEANFIQITLLKNVGILSGAFILNELNTNNSNIFSYSIVILLVLLGIGNIILYYKKFKSLINPITLFSVVWYIFIPITSFQFPLMQAMSQFQWRMVILGDIFFSIGGIISAYKYHDKELPDEDRNFEWSMPESLYAVCIFLIILGIILYLVQAKIAGGFPFFSSNPSYARSVFYIHGIGFLSNLGFICIYLIFCSNNYRRKKLFIVVSAIYLGIQLLMAVRFLMGLLFIMFLSTYSVKKLKKGQIKNIVIIVAVIIVVFVAVMSVRGGLSDRQDQFINSGLYSGSAQEIVNTELFRYFGMSQRTMETYINAYAPGYSKMTLTFSPILENIGVNIINPKRFGIHGYTATNIITNLYFDAGNLWWLLMIGWSFLMNTWYLNYRYHKKTLMNQYLWSVSAVSISMSFYCYVNSFSYWFFDYILFIFILGQIKGKISLGYKGKKG